jgi:hypothetical protein
MASRYVSTLAGSGSTGFQDGLGTNARFSAWSDSFAITPDGKMLVFAEYNGQRVRTVDTASGAVATIAGEATTGAQDGIIVSND